MRESLISQLEVITEEEQKILDGRNVSRTLYTTKKTFEVEAEKLLRDGRLIQVRTHTRFIDFPEHNHNYIEMMYVCQGKITHFIGGKEVVMEEGDFLILNQHVRHSICCASREDLGINFIALPEFFDIPLQMLQGNNVLADFLVDTLRQNSFSEKYLLFKLSGILEIENLMENIVYSLKNLGKNEEKINQLSMGLVFLHILNHIDKLDYTSPQNYKEIVLQTTLSYIDQHYKEANLSKLSEDLNQSLSVLSRMIKQNFGHTFQELVQRKKFQKAMTLLSETNLSIADIVAAVGYENSSYFYRRFQEKYHMSPREYRLTHQNGDQIRI